MKLILIKILKKNKEINCNINCLILVPEFEYNYFIIKNKKNEQPLCFKNIESDKYDEGSSEVYDYMKFKSLKDLTESDEYSEDINKEKKLKIINEEEQLITNLDDIKDNDETNSNKTINKNKKKKKNEVKYKLNNINYYKY